MAPATRRTVTDTLVPRPLFAEWVNIREEISTGILQMAPELAQVFALFGVLTRKTIASWYPSLCPRIRDHPAGFGYRNYFPVFNNHAHAAACSQVKVEVMIKTTSVEFSQRIQS